MLLITISISKVNYKLELLNLKDKKGFWQLIKLRSNYLKRKLSSRFLRELK